VDKKQQDIVDSSHKKERPPAKKIYATVIGGILAGILSCVSAFMFSNAAGGAGILLLSEGIALVLYCLIMFRVRANRSACGYISVLTGAFAAVVLSNIALLILFFGTGEYRNYGMPGVYYVFLTFVLIFTAAGVITTLLNKRSMVKSQCVEHKQPES
jgi:hypothetical protein